MTSPLFKMLLHDYAEGDRVVFALSPGRRTPGRILAGWSSIKQGDELRWLGATRAEHPTLEALRACPGAVRVCAQVDRVLGPDVGLTSAAAMHGELCTMAAVWAGLLQRQLVTDARRELESAACLIDKAMGPIRDWVDRAKQAGVTPGIEPDGTITIDGLVGAIPGFVRADARSGGRWFRRVERAWRQIENATDPSACPQCSGSEVDGQRCPACDPERGAPGRAVWPGPARIRIEALGGPRRRPDLRRGVAFAEGHVRQEMAEPEGVVLAANKDGRVITAVRCGTVYGARNLAAFMDGHTRFVLAIEGVWVRDVRTDTRVLQLVDELEAVVRQHELNKLLVPTVSLFSRHHPVIAAARLLQVIMDDRLAVVRSLESVLYGAIVLTAVAAANDWPDSPTARALRAALAGPIHPFDSGPLDDVLGALPPMPDEGAP